MKILWQRARLVWWCLLRGRVRDAVGILAHIIISILTRTRYTRRRSLLVDRLLTWTENR